MSDDHNDDQKNNKYRVVMIGGKDDPEFIAMMEEASGKLARLMEPIYKRNLVNCVKAEADPNREKTVHMIGENVESSAYLSLLHNMLLMVYREVEGMASKDREEKGVNLRVELCQFSTVVMGALVHGLEVWKFANSSDLETMEHVMAHAQAFKETHFYADGSQKPLREIVEELNDMKNNTSHADHLTPTSGGTAIVDKDMVDKLLRGEISLEAVTASAAKMSGGIVPPKSKMN